MDAVSIYSEAPPADVLRREIHRFLVAARQRSEYEIAPRRRSSRRYHRSWPLQITLNGGQPIQEFSVALHNACEQGLAFLSPSTIPVGQRIHIKLFWHEITPLLVPAVVRHNTPTEHGNLIGCEFLLQEFGDGE